MRILVLNWRDVSHPIAGGAEVYVHEMMKRWVTQDCEVTQVCPRYHNSKSYEEIDGVKIVRVGNTYSVYFKAALELIKRADKYDVVFESINTVPFFAPLFTKKPVIALIYEYVSPLLLAYESPMLAIPAAALQSQIPIIYKDSTIITIAKSAKKQLGDFGLKLDRTYIVRPGVDSKLFECCGDVKQKKFRKRIIYLGRLVRYKGLLSMVREFRKVVDRCPTTEFYIVGRGYLKPKIVKLVKELNLENNVKLTGFVTEEEKKSLLFDAAITVYPVEYFDGGWSIAEVEAMALGNVLVATVNLQDMAIESKAGFVGPVTGFSNYICSLFDDEARWRELSIRTAEWARQFTLEKIASETLDVIRKSSKNS